MRVLVTGHHGYLGTGDVLESAATYDHQVRQRLPVRPGITSLWQVSGWLRSVVGELGLSYIENWSMIGDLVIAASTVRAVFFGSPARTDALRPHAGADQTCEPRHAANRESISVGDQGGVGLDEAPITKSELRPRKRCQDEEMPV